MDSSLPIIYNAVMPLKLIYSLIDSKGKLGEREGGVDEAKKVGWKAIART